MGWDFGPRFGFREFSVEVVGFGRELSDVDICQHWLDVPILCPRPRIMSYGVGVVLSPFLWWKITNWPCLKRMARLIFVIVVT